MTKRAIAFKTKGMNRDNSVSSFNSEFSFENMNLRLSTVEGNTLMSWVNERGPKKLECSINVTPWKEEGAAIKEDKIEGNPLGVAVLNHQLVLFTTTPSAELPDNIYVLDYKDTFIIGKRIFHGNLNFNKDYPIETLVSYESEDVQKVYWTDNYNQPRVINIASTDYRTPSSYLCSTFDFAPEIQTLEDTVVHVKKVLGGGGSFPAGVIQYAFTYYNKYGQETAIFHVTPLMYTSFADRAVAPDDKVDNVFEITVRGLDTYFDFLRIYSIQRTSLNDTPIVKRVQDISLAEGKGDRNYSVTYTDTGYNEDSVDPTELLYKGSEEVTVKTMEQKDGTLFLGNIVDKNLSIADEVKDAIKDSTVGVDTREINVKRVEDSGYLYYNQLNAIDKDGYSVPCGGFKTSDYYRLGVQFQYKTGKWSRPLWIRDAQMTQRPSDDNVGTVTLPIFKALINEGIVDALWDAGYRRARPLVVFPEPQDRSVICQGVACPTVYTEQQASIDKNIHAQSSWFFRPLRGEGSYGQTPMIHATGAVVPLNKGYLSLHFNSAENASEDKLSEFEGKYNPNYNASETQQDSLFNCNIRQMEIEGLYDYEHAFQVNTDFFTLHTPELEFDEFKAGSDFTSTYYRLAGWQQFNATYSDIDIQTSSPTISDEGSGFVHKSFICEGGYLNESNIGNYGIVSGLFYNDFIVDEKDEDSLRKYALEKKPLNWMVYLWQSTGSLNNDINRPSSLGTATAVLQKKIVSNLRYGKLAGWVDDAEPITPDSIPQIFGSDEATIVKFGSKIYMGNIDTLLIPTEASGKYFSAPINIVSIAGSTWEDSANKFTNNILWKTRGKDDASSSNIVNGPYHYGNSWVLDEGVKTNIGNYYADLVRKKNAVRMKYKSTPHLVIGDLKIMKEDNKLPVIELMRTVSADTLFGGTSEDALRANTWIPCGEAVPLVNQSTLTLEYSYGDTYYQRWDCLKTYPFTTDDINQVVEIGSFTLETRYNIAGRYDRNRGQLSNLHMSPRNFNLFNPVYSQVDNFFSYKILDDASYKNDTYPNQVTWTLTKSSNADVDEWTHITLANTLELYGDKGELNKLIRFNDQLLAFQDSGVAQILYNENTQISTSEGVPIEIANSGKVQGQRYITDTLGCSNKWSMVSTPSGIYFMDNNNRDIYLFSGQIQNLSLAQGFNSWCKQNIVRTLYDKWTPQGFKNFVSYYDRVNQDVLFINADTALAYSEKVSTFTSFYNYEGSPYLVNLENTALWVRNTSDNICEIWEHNQGNYCEFFGKQQPYWITLIGNPEPQSSKVFTNLEIRATLDRDGVETTAKDGTSIFTPTLPFDGLETWDEYQHGYTALGNLTGVKALQHNFEMGSLKRRFRIWRCDIPRDNALLDGGRNPMMKYDYSTDAELKVTRTKVRPFDRMRNPWLYLKLKKNTSDTRMELHDVVMTYYS